MSVYLYIDYKKIHAKSRPRIRMLTSCMWYGKDNEFNIEYETEKDGIRELYFTDVCDGTCYVRSDEVGKEFEWVRDSKPELRKALEKVEY